MLRERRGGIYRLLRLLSTKICINNQNIILGHRDGCGHYSFFEGAEGEAFGDGCELFAAAEFICAEGS